MAHTPEPWKILKVDENGYVSSPEGKDLAITAGGIIAEVFYRIDDDVYADVEANARMMVNAPGMFNALKEVEWEMMQDGWCRECPWCGEEEPDGHSKDCSRQKVLAQVEGDQ